MSFFKSIVTGSQETQILKGANAPKNVLSNRMLRVDRLPGKAMPNNAPAFVLSNKQVTPIQSMYVRALAASSGRSTWIGKLFGG